MGDKITMQLKEIGWKSVNVLHLAQDMDKRQDAANAVLKRGIREMDGVSWLGEELAASRKRFCSMEVVSCPPHSVRHATKTHWHKHLKFYTTELFTLFWTPCTAPTANSITLYSIYCQQYHTVQHLLPTISHCTAPTANSITLYSTYCHQYHTHSF